MLLTARANTTLDHQDVYTLLCHAYWVLGLFQDFAQGGQISSGKILALHICPPPPPPEQNQILYPVGMTQH